MSSRPLFMQSIVSAVTLFVALAPAFGQDLIPLPYDRPSPSPWERPERQYYTPLWKTEAVTNVSAPALMLFQPEPKVRNGACVIVAPGGGFYALSITTEGTDVADRLTEKGFTVFVLKYRLVPTGDDGVAELADILQRNNKARVRRTLKYLNYPIADGLAAVEHVRTNAEHYGVGPDRIGMMGFSAGGVVLFGVVNRATDRNRPDFFVPVYPGLDLTVPRPNKKTPPTLFVCAADDIHPSAICKPVAAWHNAGVSTGLHLYPNGGHGFGVRRQGLPTDHWIDRFYEWAVAQKFVTPPKP